MKDNGSSISKKGQRKISNFIGQELLYDYVTSKLDPERTAAVEEYVKSSREAQADIQRINDALSYIEVLSEIHVSDNVLEQIKMPASYFQVLLRKMKVDEWSPGVKTSIEIMVVAIGVISVSLVIPWHRVMDINLSGKQDVVLSEVVKEKSEQSEIEVASKPEDESQVFKDEGAEKTKATNANQAQEKPTTTKTQENKIEKPAAVAVAETQAPTTQSEVAGAGAAPKKQGSLLRGSIVVTNVNAITPKFVEKISELGGRKAGEVELGWKKGSGSYFHFTIPEAKYQTLLDFSKEYGKLKISKEKHDRVMPEGIIRIIIIIEENHKNANDEVSP